MPPVICYKYTAVLMAGKAEQDSYSQPMLTGLEEEKSAQITLTHVVVETEPSFVQHKTGNEWHCQVYAGPDIFQQERNERWQLHARTHALEAKRQRLRPGDVVTLQGIPYTQEIQTAGGNTQHIHHLNVTSIEVQARSKRVSLTVFERERER